MADGFAMGQRATGCCSSCRCSTCIAWGLPYAALMTGASMLMPDRFLHPEPLAELIETDAADARRRRADHLAGLLAAARRARRATCPRCATSIVGGSACPPRADGGRSRSGTASTSRHAWGMTETSPLGIVARAAGRRRGRGRVALPHHPGPAAGRRSRRGWSARTARVVAAGRRGGRRAGGARAVDHRRRTTGTTTRRKFDDGWLRTGDVGTHHPGRLPHPDRPGQGRHQVRRRVDLLGRAGERADGAPGGRRGRGGRRARREVGRAAAGHRRRARRARRSTARGAARLPAERVARWQLPERWAVHRGGAQDVASASSTRRCIRRQYADGALDVQTLSSKLITAVTVRDQPR